MADGDDELRVLWFSTTPSSGGGSIRSLEHELRHRVKLSVAFYHDTASRPYEQGGTTFRPMVRRRGRHVGKAVSRITDRLESDRDVERLTDVVDASQPDVIHVHGTEDPFGLIQRHTEVPVVISIGSVLSVYELKYFSGIDRQTARRSAATSELLVRSSYAHRFRRFAKQAQREREMLAITRHLIGRTEWDRRATSVLAPQATYHHVDEILRPPFYERTWQARSQSTLELFTTTGPHLYQGFETLVRCAILLDAAGLDYRWQVAGLAAGDPFVSLFLRALGVELPARVELLGTLGETELADRMVGSDLYVGVSHIGNSPNSLCEALLMGMPCVAAYSGGTPSLITDYLDGVLVQDGDPYALAGAVGDLARDAGRAARLGHPARVRALRRHDRPAIAERTLEIYRQLVRGT